MSYSVRAIRDFASSIRSVDLADHRLPGHCEALMQTMMAPAARTAAPAMRAMVRPWTKALAAAWASWGPRAPRRGTATCWAKAIDCWALAARAGGQPGGAGGECHDEQAHRERRGRCLERRVALHELQVL